MSATSINANSTGIQMKIVWIAGAALVATLILLFFNYRSSITTQRPNVLEANPAFNNVNESKGHLASPVLPPRSLTPAAAGSGTYQPNVARTLRQIPGLLEMSYKNPNWWLYARSPEDAAWLDKHGYPTPSEEAKLKAATESELIAMAQVGDQMLISLKRQRG